MNTTRIRRTPRRLFHACTLALVCALIPAAGCAREQGGHVAPPLAETPSERPGEIDLAAYDFSRGKAVALDGDWNFIPGELLTPDDLASGGRERDAALIGVPGFWSARAMGEPEGTTLGQGTCWIDVRLGDTAGDLTLNTRQIHSSYRVWINGKAFGEEPKTRAEDEGKVASNRPGYYRIPAGTSSLRIVINVSNKWDHVGTGLPRSPRIGSERALETERLVNVGYESFIVGLLLMSALYHLMLFLIQRRDRALLFFSLISLAVLARQLATSEYFWLSLAEIPLYAIIRVEVGSVYLVCILFILYFRRLYPADCPRALCRADIAAGAALLAVTLLLPARLYSRLLAALYWYVALSVALALFILLRAVRRKEPGAPLMIAGTLLIALPSTLDILSTNLHLNTRYLMPLGLCPFIMIQSLLLARRYTRAAEDAEKLRVTTARLTRLDGMKTNFLANVSHELRTPVTLIKAPVEAIRAGEYGAEIPSGHSVFSLIQANVDRLLHLIENLLNLTRLESGEPLELAPADLSKLLKAYIAEFEPLARNKGIALALQVPDGAYVANIEVKAFETVIFNLMSNALKFTPEGGQVTVWIGLRETAGGDRIRIEIRDTGCGIAPGEIPLLFSRYRQIYDRERHQYEGSGLGLSIAQEAARALGGELRLESVEGKGTTCVIDLPSAQPGTAPLAAGTGTTKIPPLPEGRPDTGRKEASGPHKRILIVEDQADMRRFIGDSLSGEYAISEAEDGEAAWLLLTSGTMPDLILSDIMMPRMDGTRLLAKIRETPKFAAIPLIFLTARDEPAERLELLHTGGVDYIVKPFALAELRARVAAVLRQRDRERVHLFRRVQTALIDETMRENEPELTQREEEVLALVVDGVSDKEIAERLGISTRTASNHVAALLRKTGLSSRQSLRQRFGIQGRIYKKE